MEAMNHTTKLRPRVGRLPVSQPATPAKTPGSIPMSLSVSPASAPSREAPASGAREADSRASQPCTVSVIPWIPSFSACMQPSSETNRITAPASCQQSVPTSPASASRMSTTRTTEKYPRLAPVFATSQRRGRCSSAATQKAKTKGSSHSRRYRTAR